MISDPPPLNRIEGADRNAFISNRADGGHLYLSTTSNLLFGNLQRHLMTAAGYQFMVFAEDGLNSFPGVQLHQGDDNRVPHRVARYGLDRYVLLQ